MRVEGLMRSHILLPDLRKVPEDVLPIGKYLLEEINDIEQCLLNLRFNKQDLIEGGEEVAEARRGLLESALRTVGLDEKTIEEMVLQDPIESFDEDIRNSEAAVVMLEDY